MVFLPECRFKAIQGAHISLTGQENLKPGALLDGNVPGCSADRSHTTQQAAGPFLTGTTTQQLSFSDLSDMAHPSQDVAGRRQLRVRFQWLAKLREQLSLSHVEISAVIPTSDYHQFHSSYTFRFERIERKPREGRTPRQLCIMDIWH